MLVAAGVTAGASQGFRTRALRAAVGCGVGETSGELPTYPVALP
jgi:hypothetical protein